MEPAFIFASVIGVGPALLVMYYVLRGYVGGFEDRKLFIGLAVGLVLGVVGFTFHGLLDRVILYPSIFSFLIYVVGFAFLDNLMLFAVLNFKWVRGKPDAAFYGVSLGAGFSATSVMALAYGATSVAVEFFGPISILSLVGIALASTFFRTAAGALIGIGSARSEPWQWFGRALIAQVPYGTMFMALYYAGTFYELWLWVPLMAAMAAYSLWLLRFVWRNSLPEFLPGEIRRKIRRQRRRAHG